YAKYRNQHLMKHIYHALIEYRKREGLIVWGSASQVLFIRGPYHYRLECRTLRIPQMLPGVPFDQPPSTSGFCAGRHVFSDVGRKKFDTYMISPSSQTCFRSKSPWPLICVCVRVIDQRKKKVDTLLRAIKKSS
ncbi:hypothetical protein J6590_046813, partial [Homalodisca vitripennis]